jgi:hypothetical protein
MKLASRWVSFAAPVAAAICFAVPHVVRAQEEMTVASFPGVNGGSLSFSPFDPSLGTLNSVNVSIIGTVDATVIPTPNFAFNGAVIVPIPYGVTVAGSLSFTALSQNTFGGFTTSFAQPFSFSQSSISDGTGSPIDIPIFVSDSFTFNSFSDITGFAVSTDGSVEDATLSDFIAGPLSSSLSPTEIVVANVSDDGSNLPVTVPLVNVNGAMILTYNYTPETQSTGSSAVPDGGSTLAMLGGAFAGLALLRRRFARQ